MSGQALLGADHHAGDGDLVGLAHRLEEQVVRLVGAAVGRQVIRVVVVDRVDLVLVHELLDVDRARLLGIERVELLGLDDHVAVLGDLEALDDLLERHFFPGLGRDALLLDARTRLLFELVEADGLLVDGAVELHGHVDEPEADGATPDCASHGLCITASAGFHPPAGKKLPLGDHAGGQSCLSSPHAAGRSERG